MVRTLAEDSPVHRIIHEADGRIIENLARLDQLPARDFVLLVPSLSIQGGTGAPARVVALV
jgi:kynurenine formamidase